MHLDVQSFQESLGCGMCLSVINKPVHFCKVKFCRVLSSNNVKVNKQKRDACLFTSSVLVKRESHTVKAVLIGCWKKYALLMHPV